MGLQIAKKILSTAILEFHSKMLEVKERAKMEKQCYPIVGIAVFK